MSETYIYDPVELTMQAHLRGVQDEQVVVVRPDVLPSRFVQLLAAGGSEGVVSARQMLTYACFGESRADAARFGARIMAFAKSCRELGGLPVYGSRVVGGLIPRVDPETNRQMYQFTLEHHVRGRNFIP